MHALPELQKCVLSGTAARAADLCLLIFDEMQWIANGATTKGVMHERFLHSRDTFWNVGGHAAVRHLMDCNNGQGPT